jgi:hypothetical protein
LRKQLKIIGLMLCVVSALTTQGQAFFNRFELCDSCLAATNAKLFLNHKNEIITLGVEDNFHSRSFFLNNYLGNSTSSLRYKYEKSLSPINYSLFQNENNNYHILCQQLIDNASIFLPGICFSYLIKIDTNFNIYEKKLLSTSKYDSCDFFAKSFFFNNQIYTFSNAFDSANGYWIKSAGMSISDTNGNVLKRNVFHLFPNQEADIKGVSRFASNFYITGTYQVDPDICTNNLESFIIKVDTLGNYVSHKTFAQPYANLLNGNLAFAPNRLFVTGTYADTCIGINSLTKQQNIILDSNLNVINTQVYANAQVYQAGTFVLPRTDSTLMLVTLKQPTKVNHQDFVFQVCNTRGEVLTESSHTIPTDSSIINSDGNIANDVIFNPNTKGYLLVGSASRLNSNGVTYANSEPWIMSVDSNGCIDNANIGCAIPLQIKEQAISQSKLLAYPNPSETGKFTINTTEKKLSWRVFNIEGKTIAEGTTNQVNISNQTTGMYILQIKTNNYFQTLKLQKS